MSSRLVYILAATALLFSSCGSKRSEAHQSLHLNLSVEPPSLDPRKATDATSINVLLMLFEGLMRIGPDHKPKPAIAKKVQVSKDNLTFTFYLRKTYWSNGDPVTSEDFAYAWKKILDPKFPSLFAYKLYIIQNAAKVKSGLLPLDQIGVETPNLSTLIVHLEHPAPYFLELLAFPTLYPVHHKIDQQQTGWASDATPNYVGNGPFYLHRWTHDNELVVKKNPLYWDSDSVILDSIHLSMIEDTTTELYMYEMGELDWAGSPLSNLPPEVLPALFKEKKVKSYPASAVYYFKINTSLPSYSNKWIRKAFGLAINRQEIVEHVMQAGQISATAMVPPMPGWEGVSSFFKDGDAALAQEYFQRGLKELNLKQEDFPVVKLCYNSSREHQKVAQAIQNQWKNALGIRVELENYDWKVYLSMINKQNYEVGRSGWIGDFHDPISFLGPFKYRDSPLIGGNNETGWEHPDFTFLIDQAEREANPGKRANLLHAAESLLMEEMPVIPVYFIQCNYLSKPYVKNVYLSPLGQVDFKRAYVEK